MRRFAEQIECRAAIIKRLPGQFVVGDSAKRSDQLLFAKLQLLADEFFCHGYYREINGTRGGILTPLGLWSDLILVDAAHADNTLL